MEEQKLVTLPDSLPKPYFRPIQESDYQQIKALHEEFFPVRYSDSFFLDVCKGKGLHDGPLFSRIAVNSYTHEIVGFVLAQILPYPDRCDDSDLFAIGQNPKNVCYILTLGMRPAYRRFGIATLLMENCMDYAKNNNCGAVYLHVINYNKTALNFYERNDFTQLKTLSGFYRIDGVDHTAYLYIYYLNGFCPPMMKRLILNASSIAGQGYQYLANWLYAVVPQNWNQIIPQSAVDAVMSKLPNVLALQSNPKMVEDPPLASEELKSGQMC